MATIAQAAGDEGRTYWALVSRQFARRRSAVVGGVVVLGLFTLAIFAPLLANGYPYYARIENPHAYRTDFNGWTINHRALAVQLARANTPAAEEALAERFKACAIKLLQMKLQLDDERVAVAATLEELYERAEDAELSDRPALAKELTVALEPARQALNPDKVQLVARDYYPLVRQISAPEVFAMALYVCAFAYALGAWRPARAVVARLGAARHTPAIARALVLLAIPAAAALAWRIAVPRVADHTPYDVLARESGADVRFLPIPYFPDKATSGVPVFLPPSWTSRSQERIGEHAAITNKPRYEPIAPHLLGTDQYGYDVLARMIWGARISLSVGFISVGLYGLIGVIVGALAGYYRGSIDMAMSRVIEVVICFPTMFLIIIIMSFVPPSVVTVMVVIGITGWPGVARLVRGEFLRLASSDFVTAAQALGIRTPRIIFRHILPNAIAPVLVVAAFGIAGTILTESALSYLGIGVPLDTPTWGALLRGVKSNPKGNWWLTVFPGAAVFVAVTAYNLVAEGMRDAIDPKLKE